MPTRAGRRRGASPGGADAYESNWYRVLSRMAESGVDPGPGEAADRDGASAWDGASPPEDPSSDGHGSSGPEPIAVAEAPPSGTLEFEDEPVAHDGLLHIIGPTPPSRVTKSEPTPHAKGSAPTVERPRVIHSTVRIGVRKASDPEDVYVEYLTRSQHADFFRGDWWPGGRSLTPVHLWRANHLGAEWDLEAVRRFMAGPAAQAERLLEAAPRRDAPGTPARRMWFRRLVEQDWVQELGVPRICKTLHPLAPELVPSFDPVVTPWVGVEWLGLRSGPEAPDPVEGWTDVWELLEDTLVLRGDILSDIVRSAHERAPGRSPVGRLGLMNAVFWDSYWREGMVREPDPPRRSGRTARAGGKTAGTRRTSGRRGTSPDGAAPRSRRGAPDETAGGPEAAAPRRGGSKAVPADRPRSGGAERPRGGTTRSRSSSGRGKDEKAPVAGDPVPPAPSRRRATKV
jgi:hypothetical protein